MTKRILITLFQFACFCGLFYVGGYWDIIHLTLAIRYPRFNVIPLWKFHINPSLDYIANGLIFASILFVLILLFEALRRRLRPWALLTTLAFVLASIASMVVKSGFLPISNT
ncbi:MAG TPA: hypothetical protein VGN16_23905 [Acidobacteriaceae bacterium]|jgi:hypothetical protein